MEINSTAVLELERWLASHASELGVRQTEAGDAASFDFGLTAPHLGVMRIVDGEWEFQLITARGTRNTVLGPIDASQNVILDAVMFSVYMRATAELDRPDRSASAELSALLRRLADTTDDARYGGRAAMLLAGHAIKDGYALQAHSRVEDAIRLFAVADDITAEENARAVLANLPRLLSQHGS